MSRENVDRFCKGINTINNKDQELRTVLKTLLWFLENEVQSGRKLFKEICRCVLVHRQTDTMTVVTGWSVEMQSNTDLKLAFRVSLLGDNSSALGIYSTVPGELPAPEYRVQRIQQAWENLSDFLDEFVRWYPFLESVISSYMDVP